MLYVLARSYEQAVYYAGRLGMTEWRYVAKARDLYGAHEARIVRVGPWYDRSDASEIIDVAASQGMVLVDPVIPDEPKQRVDRR
jgi:hypothetical protein